MDKQQRALRDEIGGEPLDGSGFEDEQPAFDQDIDAATDQEEQW